ncbi:MAG: substrate-binding domain-containing protein [Desulfuromonadales bacterium]|nr:substrate-binding domain-containing protein [Desulfuromonadales bacterium]
MFRNLCTVIFLFLLSCPVFANETPQPKSEVNQKVVRAAIIGGMSLSTELFDEIAKMFEADTGYKVKIVASGPRPGLADVMRKGEVDFLTMHSGDITTELVADGYAVNMRPWTRNDLIIIGPASDPAKIAGFTDGAAALARIAETKSNFIDFKGIGPRELGNTLWKRSGKQLTGSWVIKDEIGDHGDVLSFVERKKAYMIIGRIPVVTGKLGRHNLKIMVEKDPTMRRPYIAMEANPETFPATNVQGARALSDYLLSNKIQSFLAVFGTKQNNGIPMFHPLVKKPPVKE